MCLLHARHCKNTYTALPHLMLRTTQCSRYYHSYLTYLGLWLERLGNLLKSHSA